MAQWTPEELTDVVMMTPREFEAKHPKAHTPAAIHVKRRQLRDAGINVTRSPIGRPPDPIRVTMPELPEAPTEEQLWEAYDQIFALKRRHEDSKALQEADIAIETDYPVGIVFMSDFHLGGDGVDTQRLREDVELIRSCDRLRVFVGGDGIDNFIVPALSHVQRDTALVSPEMQMLLFRSIIEKLLPQLLAVGTGNHDLWTQKMAGIDANLYALRGLPVLHTKEDTYLNMTVGSQRYVIWRKHRPPSGVSKNNPTGGIQNAFRNGERPFDIGVTEHFHTPHVSSFSGHGMVRWAITTGSYKVRDEHARMYGHTDSRVGTPVIVLFPHRRTMIPFMSLSDAIDFLEAA